MKVYGLLLFIYIFCAAQISSADEKPYGSMPGYIDDVDEEFPPAPQNLDLVEKPEVLSGPSLHKKIFNDELSTEFINSYREKFGRTEQEENYFLTNKQGYYITPTGLSATEQDENRRVFAEYMLKRLTEFHTENMMKTDPQFKRVYEIKQAVSNVKVEVGESSHFDLQYSFVGNFLRGQFHNPYVPTYLYVQMNAAAVIPSAPEEVELNGRRQLTHTIIGETGYKFYEKAVRFMVEKALRHNVFINLTETVHVAGFSPDNSKENLTLAGLRVIF